MLLMELLAYCCSVECYIVEAIDVIVECSQSEG